VEKINAERLKQLLLALGYAFYSTPERGEIMREWKRQMQDSSMAIHNYH